MRGSKHNLYLWQQRKRELHSTTDYKMRKEKIRIMCYWDTPLFYSVIKLGPWCDVSKSPGMSFMIPGAAVSYRTIASRWEEALKLRKALFPSHRGGFPVPYCTLVVSWWGSAGVRYHQQYAGAQDGAAHVYGVGIPNRPRVPLPQSKPCNLEILTHTFTHSDTHNGPVSSVSIH